MLSLDTVSDNCTITIVHDQQQLVLTKIAENYILINFARIFRTWYEHYPQIFRFAFDNMHELVKRS